MYRPRSGKKNLLTRFKVSIVVSVADVQETKRDGVCVGSKSYLNQSRSQAFLASIFSWPTERTERLIASSHWPERFTTNRAVLLGEL